MNSALQTSRLRCFGLSAFLLLLCRHALAAPAIDPLIDRFARQIQTIDQPAGLVIVVIDGNRTWQRFLGETRPGNRTSPQDDTLIRIASLSKLFTSEMLVTLARAGQLNIDDPLQKYAPVGVSVPQGGKGQIIRLSNLATHTSGLPREMPGPRPAKAPVFTWPTQSERWQWLARAQLNAAPGTRAAYSNLAFDLLADALTRAGGEPYPIMLRDKLTQPLGMRDTTFTPTAAQCARLMQGFGANPCGDTLAAYGSGGLYTTAHDMALWLRAQLDPHNAVMQQTQRLIYRRQDLRSFKGLDLEGRADALGLGWVYMAAQNGRPAILQKTGGITGAASYVAINPQQQIGIFVSATSGRHFSRRGMDSQTNQLVATLAKLPR